jgi:hypothetical protein
MSSVEQFKRSLLYMSRCRRGRHLHYSSQASCPPTHAGCSGRLPVKRFITGSRAMGPPTCGSSRGRAELRVRLPISALIHDFAWSRDGKQLLLAKGNESSDVILISNFRKRLALVGVLASHVHVSHGHALNGVLRSSAPRNGLWKDADPRHPQPEGSQGEIREVAVACPSCSVLSDRRLHACRMQPPVSSKPLRRKNAATSAGLQVCADQR